MGGPRNHAIPGPKLCKLEANYAIDEDDCYDYDHYDNADDGDDDDDDDDDADDTTTATTMVMMTTTRTICSLHVYEVCPSDSDSWAESAGRIQPMFPCL